MAEQARVLTLVILLSVAELIWTLDRPDKNCIMDHCVLLLTKTKEVYCRLFSDFLGCTSKAPEICKNEAMLRDLLSTISRLKKNAELQCSGVNISRPVEILDSSKCKTGPIEEILEDKIVICKPPPKDLIARLIDMLKKSGSRE